MTQGFLQPKGSIKKQDIGPIVQQWAKEQAQGQLNATPEVNPLRDTVQDLLLKSLQKDITIPKTYTTIQDIFNANEGDRFNALADWFQSPQFNRFTGGDYTFDPESKRMMSTGERIARRQEAQLRAEQEKALEAQKQQLGIAEGLNKEFNDMDIEDKRLQADAEQFAQSLALDREKIAEMRRHNQAMEANAANKAKGNVNTEDLKVINNQLDRFRDSFTKVRPTKAGALLAGKVADKGFGNEDETYFNAQKELLVNAVTRTLGGEKGIMSDQDIARFAKALPELSDSDSQKRAKLKASYDLLGDRLSAKGIAFENPYNQTSNNTTSGSTTQPTKVGGYTVRVKGN